MIYGKVLHLVLHWFSESFWLLPYELDFEIWRIQTLRFTHPTDLQPSKGEVATMLEETRRWSHQPFIYTADPHVGCEVQQLETVLISVHMHALTKLYHIQLWLTLLLDHLLDILDKQTYFRC